MIARTRRRRLDAPDEVTTEDNRLITKTLEAWERQRVMAHDRAGGRCEGRIPVGGSQTIRCNRLAPLHKKTVQGRLIKAGEAHHRNRRKVRDDRAETLEWLCWLCHLAQHVPAKVVPKKEVVMKEVDQEITDTGAASPMPQYQCHKKVWALKIAKVEHVKYDTTTDENEIVEVSFEGRFAPRRFNLLGKPRPDAGWYYVQYVGGYESFSPAKEFEEGYTRIS